MKKKINKVILFRLIFALSFWSTFFFFALFVPKKLQFKSLWRIFINLFLWATKIKPIYVSDFDLSKSEPIIIAPNHKCFVDTYIVLKFIKRRFSVVFNKNMTNGGNIFFKFMAWRIGMVPVDRNGLAIQRTSFKKIIKLINDDFSILMFPEGKYHFDAPVGKLMRGIAKISSETGISILPMAIYGIKNDFLYEKKTSWRNVYLKSGTLLKYADFNDDKLFLDTIKNKIEELYLELEKEYNDKILITKGNK